MNPPDPARAAFELSFAFFRSHRDHIAAVLGPLRITPPQMHALRALRGGERLRMSELAVRMYVDRPHATGAIDGLVERGLAVREQADDDKRSRIVRLTPDGEALADGLERRMGVPAAIAVLDPADQERLRQLLSASAERTGAWTPFG